MALKTARDWVVLAATVAGMALTLSLARWQLNRAHQKEAIVAAMAQRHSQPPVGNADLLSGADLRYRQVQLSGHWVPSRAIYLDNRQMYGQPGFYLVVPLQLAGSNRAVLVQRGWVPRDAADRTRVPPVVAAPGEVQVRGIVAPPPGRLYAFGGDDAGLIRQNVDLRAFARESGLALLPLSVQETAGDPGDGLKRDWPAVDEGIERHYGYAGQWLLFALMMAGLYVWFQWLGPRFKQPREHA